MTNRFEERYKIGDLPWDIKRPDYNLVNILKTFPIKAGKGLDVGCGTGDNVIWLSQQGFEMTGVDFAQTAIELARRKTEMMNVEATLHTLDFLAEPVPGGPFAFVFDRGCFHTFDTEDERSLYARNVHGVLEKDGWWLTIAGNYDDGRLDIGPPKRKATEIVKAVEPLFQIISITSGRFDSNDAVPSKIWICLMQKRQA
jgi:SAM-dependent methyltransferase